MEHFHGLSILRFEDILLLAPPSSGSAGEDEREPWPYVVAKSLLEHDPQEVSSASVSFVCLIEHPF